MDGNRIERVNVTDAVLERMKRNLLEGVWASGDRIPGENELARQFGVSRGSVREAIHRLIGMGALVARHGDGTFVADPAGGSMQSRLMAQLLLSPPELGEVLEFRRMVEVGGAALAAQRATEEDVRQLRALEAAMRDAGSDAAAFAACDLKYHNAVAVLSGNRLLTQVMAVVQGVYAEAMEETIRLRGMESGRFNHAPITDAIEAHDGPLAEALMREHIESVIEQLGKGDFS